MLSDSPNSTQLSNLNPSFHPLISNFNLASPSSPHPLFTHHQDLLTDHPYFPLLLPIVHETLIVGETGAPGSYAPSPSSLSSKPAMRRQTKIHTSQGLRDRRVRLSIGIARQFFDLQDMLGFDKASQTLDWLLSNSNDAIRELARSKLEESPASADCHVATGQTDHSIIGSNQKKKKKITRARKKICCDNSTAVNQSELTRASTSTSAQNNYKFPNLALDWEDSYNPVLSPTSFVVSDMNLSGTGLGAQSEHTMY